MIIGKIIGFFVKIGLAITIGIIALVLIVGAMIDGGKSYVESARPVYDDASYVISTHKIVENAAVGSTCICVICMKNNDTTVGVDFVKVDNDLNCCCWDHENQYHRIYRAWTVADKATVEGYGLRFQ